MISHIDTLKKILRRAPQMSMASGPEDDARLVLEYEKFFQAVAASPSSVIITDADGVIEYVNDRFVESTGYTRDQAVGRKPNLLKSGLTPASVYEDLWATITAGKTWRGELCNRRRTGEHYWEATAIAPIIGPDRKPSHYVAVKEDITERRRAEDKLKARQQRDEILARVTETLLASVSDESVCAALKELGAGLNAHRAFLFRLSGDKHFITNTHEWQADGVVSSRAGFEGLPCEAFSWPLDRYRDGQSLAVDDVAALSEDAGVFKAALMEGAIRATLTAPIRYEGAFLGFVGVDMEDAPRAWTADDTELTERFAKILGLALLRMDAETDLHVAHHRATRAEQNLRDAIESLSEGFVLYDSDGNLEICNDRFRRDYGYGSRARPGVHFTELGRYDVSRGQVVVPEGYKDTESYLRSRLAYRTQLEGTFPVLLADGRYLMTRDRRTSSGGLVSIQTDITRIKKTEEALRVSERKFWSVFHASPSLMAISSVEDSRFLDVNAKWTEIMGFDYTETIGRTALELGVWTSSGARDRMVSAFNADGILTDYEGQMRTRAGEIRDFLMSGALIPIDGVKHLLLVCHDITERKNIERALKRSEREVRTILDSIVEAFYRTDAEGNLLMASAAIKTLLGYDPEDLIGTPVKDLYLDPEERGGFLQAMAENGGEVRDFETRLKRKDGAVIWVATNAKYLYDLDDNIVGLEGTTRDITQQKQAETALWVAKEEAERANAAKSEFLSGMSHELRTPLNAVIGFSQMMELQAKGDLTEHQREYLQIIRTSGEHLLSLINEILDLAKVEAGRMVMRASTVDTQSLIQDAVQLVTPLAKARGIAVRVEVPDNVAHIYVDRTKFKQILINLLSNAVKYNVDDGSVTVRATVGDGVVSIAVADTGLGLSPEDCAALFEPFQRLGAEKSDVEGTGLGLVLAKRMVEAMGGAIDVESAPDKGSVFTLTVPIGS